MRHLKYLRIAKNSQLSPLGLLLEFQQIREGSKRRHREGNQGLIDSDWLKADEEAEEEAQNTIYFDSNSTSECDTQMC